METAVNLLLDGSPLIGEKVVVIGQGIIGLLTTALLSRFPLASLATVDVAPTAARGIDRVLAQANALIRRIQHASPGWEEFPARVARRIWCTNCRATRQR